MIRKELLSEVLGDERIKGENISVAGNLLHYDRLTHMTYINIYELAHRCKEWAWDNGYIVDSAKIGHKRWMYDIHEEATRYQKASGWKTTEPEAIFKACEFILEQKESK